LRKVLGRDCFSLTNQNELYINIERRKKPFPPAQTYQRESSKFNNNMLSRTYPYSLKVWLLVWSFCR